MKIYISSKMSGHKDYNFPAFYKKEKELKDLGFEVINPAIVGEQFGTDKPHSFYMKKSIELLLKADVLLVFGKDNEGSRGVEFEIYSAKMFSIPVWYDKGA